MGSPRIVFFAIVLSGMHALTAVLVILCYKPRYSRLGLIALESTKSQSHKSHIRMGESGYNIVNNFSEKV